MVKIDIQRKSNQLQYDFKFYRHKSDEREESFSITELKY